MVDTDYSMLYAARVVAWNRRMLGRFSVRKSGPWRARGLLAVLLIRERIIFRVCAFKTDSDARN